MRNFLLTSMVALWTSSALIGNPLEGFWLSTCSPTEEASLVEYVEFTDNDDEDPNTGIAKVEVRNYTDKECKEGETKKNVEVGYKIQLDSENLYKLDLIRTREGEKITHYTILQISEKDEKTNFSLGNETEEQDGSTEEKRPTEVDTSIVYVKQ